MSLEIVHYNDPVLRKKGEKITEFDEALATFADQMIETMHEAHGIGLAAQQVGPRPSSFAWSDLRGTEAEFDWKIDGAKTPLELFMPMVIVNPKLTVARKTPTVSLEEGCLSFPEIRGEVVRADSISAKFQDAARPSPHARVHGTFRPVHPPRGRPPERHPLHRPNGQGGARRR